MSNRKLFLVGLAVALGIAVGVAQLASSSPDGLEFVAAEEGFIDTAVEHDLAGAPLAGYGGDLTDSNWVNTAVAGLGGTLATLGIGYGVFWFARKTNHDDRESAST